jgi:hypothetical protein
MLSLEKAIEKCKREKLLEGELEYTDIIPCSVEEIDYEKDNFIRLLEGRISSEDDANIDKEDKAASIYEKYIFNQEVDDMSLEIDDQDVEDLIDLRLTLSPESKYLERWDKLMFRIYFEKDRSELKGLVLRQSAQYKWAEEMRNKYPERKSSVSVRGKETDYDNDNRESASEGFGNEENKEDDKNIAKEMKTEGNWILQKFGSR